MASSSPQYDAPPRPPSPVLGASSPQRALFPSKSRTSPSPPPNSEVVEFRQLRGSGGSPPPRHSPPQTNSLILTQQRVQQFPAGTRRVELRGRDMSSGPTPLERDTQTGTYAHPSPDWRFKGSSPRTKSRRSPLLATEESHQGYTLAFELDSRLRPPPERSDSVAADYNRTSVAPLVADRAAPPVIDANGRWVDTAVAARGGSYFSPPRSARLQTPSSAAPPDLLATLSARPALRPIPASPRGARVAAPASHLQIGETPSVDERGAPLVTPRGVTVGTSGADTAASTGSSSARWSRADGPRAALQAALAASGKTPNERVFGATNAATHRTATIGEEAAGLSSDVLNLRTPRYVRSAATARMTDTAPSVPAAGEPPLSSLRRALVSGAANERPFDSVASPEWTRVGIRPRRLPDAPAPDAAGGGVVSEVALGVTPRISTSSMVTRERGVYGVVDSPRTRSVAATHRLHSLLTAARGEDAFLGTPRVDTELRNLTPQAIAAMDDVADADALPVATGSASVRIRGRGTDPKPPTTRVRTGGVVPFVLSESARALAAAVATGEAPSAGEGRGRAGLHTYSAPAPLSVSTLRALNAGGRRGPALRELLGAPYGFTADGEAFVFTDWETLTPRTTRADEFGLVGVSPRGEGVSPRSAHGVSSIPPGARTAGHVGTVFSPVRSATPSGVLRTTRGRNDPEAERDTRGDRLESVNVSLARAAAGGAPPERPPSSTRRDGGGGAWRPASVHTKLRLHAGVSAGGALGNSFTPLITKEMEDMGALSASATRVAQGRLDEAEMVPPAGLLSPLEAAFFRTRKKTQQPEAFSTAPRVSAALAASRAAIDAQNTAPALSLGEAIDVAVTNASAGGTNNSSCDEAGRSHARAASAYSPLRAGRELNWRAQIPAGATNPVLKSNTQYDAGVEPYVKLTDIHSLRELSSATLSGVFSRLDDATDDARWAAMGHDGTLVSPRANSALAGLHVADAPRGLRTTDVNPSQMYARSALGRDAMIEAVAESSPRGAYAPADSAATARAAALRPKGASVLTLHPPASALPAYVLEQAQRAAHRKRIPFAIPVDFSKAPPPVAPYSHGWDSGGALATSLDGGAAAQRAAVANVERDAEIAALPHRARVERFRAGDAAAAALTHEPTTWVSPDRPRGVRMIRGSSPPSPAALALGHSQYTNAVRPSTAPATAKLNDTASSSSMWALQMTTQTDVHGAEAASRPGTASETRPGTASTTLVPTAVTRGRSASATPTGRARSAANNASDSNIFHAHASRSASARGTAPRTYGALIAQLQEATRIASVRPGTAPVAGIPTDMTARSPRATQGRESNSVRALSATSPRA